MLPFFLHDRFGYQSYDQSYDSLRPLFLKNYSCGDLIQILGWNHQKVNFANYIFSRVLSQLIQQSSRVKTDHIEWNDSEIKINLPETDSLKKFFEALVRGRVRRSVVAVDNSGSSPISVSNSAGSKD
ncbi:MAG: hypothetical protein EZS28_042445 [Streblomastix strix]|uniref:Uncharacterized protein n=1 Tax=Streblomastix strix TaxID=222440 RepID=A0A5J4TV33_9EUKA|nr:MAG: hypothetical protein EZS28_042445 [Streblomastix strix]